MPSQPEAQGDILKEFREGTFLSSLDTHAVMSPNLQIRQGIVRETRNGYARTDLHSVQPTTCMRFFSGKR